MRFDWHFIFYFKLQFATLIIDSLLELGLFTGVKLRITTDQGDLKKKLFSRRMRGNRSKTLDSFDIQ